MKRWIVEEDRDATETTYYEVEAETREEAIAAVRAGNVDPIRMETFSSTDGDCTYADTHENI